ncbi:asparaginase [Chitinolyticbacter meiyuanensis]|uniref:asparaginase n=1 Tax=Chitinolyticbacter meiyuanensis TaxID=682798 RepID=UPI0011E5F157|nr:asparaginase [Chitinolyticbacter meiyuanensis]
MRIRVIHTGGTIGMRPGPHGLATAPGWLAGELMRQYPYVDVHEYVQLLDSSSMTPADWVRIAQDVAESAEGYDGFLVLHGTDTLAWTAAALAYQLQGLGKPVLLTGAMRPWGAAESDAPRNVAAALAWLESAHQATIGVVFAGRLWPATRVRKMDCDALDAFSAPNAAALAVFEAGGWQLAMTSNALTIGEPLQPLAADARVLHLTLAPGCNADWLAAQLRQSPPDGLLLSTYGSGNAPAHPALLEVLTRLAGRIPMVNLTACPRGTVAMGQYAAGNALAAAGLWSGGDMTPEAALVKLHWLLAQPQPLAMLRQRFETCVAGDRTPA